MVKKLLNLSKVPVSDEVNQYLKAKSKSTAKSYKSNLKRFRKFYGKSIPEFIKEVEMNREKNKSLSPIERRRYFEETINEFIKWMQDLGYANNAVRGSMSALQNLFKYYEVPISYSFVKMPPPISKKINHKHKWRIEEIKKYVSGAKSYRDKAIILVMFQSGMAVGEICGLDYGDVSRELNSGELPLLIDIVRVKNSNVFKTLLGADAVKYLKLYLGTRVNLSNGSPLFTKQGTEKRLTVGAIQMRLRELADKVFGIEEEQMNPYRPHSLRSAFRSRLTGKTDGDLIKFWMGDVLGPKAGAYLNLPDEEHRELYSVIERRLSIETISTDVKKEKEGKERVPQEALNRISDLEDLVSSLIGELEATKQEQARHVKELEVKLAKAPSNEVQLQQQKTIEVIQEMQAELKKAVKLLNLNDAEKAELEKLRKFPP